MSFNQEIRKRHSLMEYEKATSYSIMAFSNEYRLAYEKYVPIIEKIKELKVNENLKILNLGYGSGTVENILLTKFQGLKFYSIDDSDTFHKICSNQNSKFIDEGRLELLKIDLNEEKININNFDVILSRDFNHHIFSPKEYISQCYYLLNEDGIMLMEDLKYDADFDGIHKFSELIFKIPEYKTDRWNFYHKMLGLYESFASAYLVEDILKILESIPRFFFNYKVTDTRYHFILYKNKENNFLADEILKLI